MNPGRRHLLVKVVPGIMAGLLVGEVNGQCQEPVIYKGQRGTFVPDGAVPVSKGAAQESTLERQQTERYEDLTAAEMVSMTVGVPLQRSEPHQAFRVMQLSLDLEHFISVLPLDATKVPRETLAEIKKLRDQLTQLSGIKVLLHLFGEAPRITEMEEAVKTRNRYWQ